MDITHPDRAMFAGAAYTKRDVADYYRAVADRLLPGIAGRPLSVLRCPDGRDGECFVQKHPGPGFGKDIHTRMLGQDEGKEGYLYVDAIEGVLALVQLNAIEFHPWGARIDAPDRADRLVFDLDPGDGVGWDAVVAGAREVRDRLAHVGLASFVRLSGGKGLHVVAPLSAPPPWDDARLFCQGIADAMAADAPGLYVATMSLARRKGRIFIDWLRNGRGSTSVASWSLRARAGAPVAIPLRWDELGRTAGAAAYDLTRARRRAAALKDDPWAGIDRLDQALPTP